MSVIDYKNGGKPALPKWVAPASDKQVAFAKKLLAERVLPHEERRAGVEAAIADPSLTKVGASTFIDLLLGCPKKPVVHEDGAEVGEGYYWVNGLVYKAQLSKAGHLYAKVFSESGYEYAPGGKNLLKNAERLTLEQAAELGVKTGRCVICAKLLTVPESVAAGIGPVCAGKFGA